MSSSYKKKIRTLNTQRLLHSEFSKHFRAQTAILQSKLDIQKTIPENVSLVAEHAIWKA
jgi:hypothetical protein